MKYFKKLLFAASLIPALCFSQSDNKHLKRGDVFYNSLRYKNAIPYYLKVAENNGENKYAIEQLANCFRNIKDYSDAEVWYAKLSGSPNVKAEAVLNYAEVLANNGKYKEASKWYKKYCELNPNDERGRTFASIYDTGTGLFADSTDWDLSYISINSSRADFSPSFFNRGLVFVSNRSPGSTSKRIFGWDNSPFTDFYFVNDTAEIKNINPDLNEKNAKNKTRILNPDDTPNSSSDSKTLGNISEFVSEKGLSGTMFSKDLNSKYHDGPISFAQKESWAIMNRNGGKGKDGVNRLKLYTANYTGGQWFGIEPFQYNSNDYSMGHPTLSEDGNTLYFISDMPGGCGGTDLYYCTRSVTGWSKPVNLGERVNTSGNEMFPFLSGDDRLYFSSTGLPGLGGLDLFYVNLNDKIPAQKPKNLGYPINSSKDDFGIITQNNGMSGYISSNRLGDDDIYKFTFNAKKVKLRGFVFENNKTGKEGILGARIVVKTDNLIDTVSSDSVGNFYASLQRNKQYSVEALKEGYRPKTITLNTTNVAGGEAIESTIDLAKLIKEGQIIAKTDNINPLRELKIRSIYYEFNKHQIGTEEKPILDNLANFMVKNPNAEIVASSFADSRGTSEYNQKITDKRSIAVKTYLAGRGVDISKIKTASFGETAAVNNCTDGISCSEADQQLNRRTEFKVKLQDSTLVSSGLPADSMQINLPENSSEANYGTYRIENIYYGFDSHTIENIYYNNLDSIAAALKAHPDWKIKAASYSDSKGSIAYNSKLSMQRSEAVKVYLKAKGIDDGRIITSGFGKSNLVKECKSNDCTNEQQQLNRRTEFLLIK